MNAEIQPLSPESLTVISYQGKPVITTDILAGIYATDEVRIRQNYSRNADRFVDGKHFFKLENGELREFKKSLSSLKLPCEIPRQAKSLMLWTERGAARHAKMLDTDQSWEVFEKLEDCYFSRREPEPKPQYGLKELPAPKTKKALPGCLTCEQQDTIKALVKSRVEACPKAKQGAAAITCWSSIKSKFGVGYKEVPAEHFQDVLSLVARLELPLEGEHIPAAQAVPAIFNGNLLVEVKDGRIAWARSIGPDEYLMTEASFRARMERIGIFLVDAGDEDAVTAFAEQHITSAANSYRVALTCLSKLANRTIHQAS